MATEEGRPIQLRIEVTPQQQFSRVEGNDWEPVRVPLRSPVPATAPNLIKMAPAADPWTSALAVSFNSKRQPIIWGLVDQVVYGNLELISEIRFSANPLGLQIVVNGVGDISVYEGSSFLARLLRDEVYNREVDVLASGPVHASLAAGVKPVASKVVASLREPRFLDAEASRTHLEEQVEEEYFRVIRRLLININRYKHGGAVLISDDNHDLDIKHRIAYNRFPRLIGDLCRELELRENAEAYDIFALNRSGPRKTVPKEFHEAVRRIESRINEANQSLTGAIKFIATLSRIDGLILCGTDLSVRGFGVEIVTKEDVKSVSLSASSELAPKTTALIPANRYGTRHRSMMRYCLAHPGSVGFVISQDGEVRAVTSVRGSVAMWENLKLYEYGEYLRIRIPDKKKLSREHRRESAARHKHVTKLIVKMMREEHGTLSPRQMWSRLLEKGYVDFDLLRTNPDLLYPILTTLVNQAEIERVGRGRYVWRGRKRQA
jgi:hypothetical protein